PERGVEVPVVLPLGPERELVHLAGVRAVEDLVLVGTAGILHVVRRTVLERLTGTPIDAEHLFGHRDGRVTFDVHHHHADLPHGDVALLLRLGRAGDALDRTVGDHADVVAFGRYVRVDRGLGV